MRLFYERLIFNDKTQIIMSKCRESFNWRISWPSNRATLSSEFAWFLHCSPSREEPSLNYDISYKTYTFKEYKREEKGGGGVCKARSKRPREYLDSSSVFNTHAARKDDKQQVHTTRRSADRPTLRVQVHSHIRMWKRERGGEEKKECSRGFSKSLGAITRAGPGSLSGLFFKSIGFSGRKKGKHRFLNENPAGMSLRRRWM